MKKSIGSVFLAFVFLMILFSGCAPVSTTIPPTPTPAPPTNINGDWEGIGTTPEGKEILLSFTVENNEITFIVIAWSGTTGDGCATLGASSGLLAGEGLLTTPIEISNYTFSEEHFNVTGIFESNTLASGTINVTNDGSVRPDCKGTFKGNWEGTKK